MHIKNNRFIFFLFSIMKSILNLLKNLKVSNRVNWCKFCFVILLCINRERITRHPKLSNSSRLDDDDELLLPLTMMAGWRDPNTHKHTSTRTSHPLLSPSYFPFYETFIDNIVLHFLVAGLFAAMSIARCAPVFVRRARVSSRACGWARSTVQLHRGVVVVAA